MNQENFAISIRDAGSQVAQAEADLAVAEATEKRTMARLMLTAQVQHQCKTAAAQTSWADNQDEMEMARIERGAAKGSLAAAKANLLAAEVAFKTWQTEMATHRAERRATRMKLTINIELEVLETKAIEMVVDEFFMDELEGLIAGDGLGQPSSSQLEQRYEKPHTSEGRTAWMDATVSLAVPSATGSGASSAPLKFTTYKKVRKAHLSSRSARNITVAVRTPASTPAATPTKQGSRSDMAPNTNPPVVRQIHNQQGFFD